MSSRADVVSTVVFLPYRECLCIPLTANLFHPPVPPIPAHACDAAHTRTCLQCQTGTETKIDTRADTHRHTQTHTDRQTDSGAVLVSEYVMTDLECLNDVHFLDEINLMLQFRRQEPQHAHARQRVNVCRRKRRREEGRCMCVCLQTQIRVHTYTHTHIHTSTQLKAHIHTAKGTHLR